VETTINGVPIEEARTQMLFCAFGPDTRGEYIGFEISLLEHESICAPQVDYCNCLSADDQEAIAKVTPEGFVRKDMDGFVLWKEQVYEVPEPEPVPEPVVEEVVIEEPVLEEQETVVEPIVEPEPVEEEEEIVVAEIDESVIIHVHEEALVEELAQSLHPPKQTQLTEVIHDDSERLEAELEKWKWIAISASVFFVMLIAVILTCICICKKMRQQTKEAI